MRQKEKSKIRKIPKRLQVLLWSANINHLDIERDRGYIVHQVLIYGLIEDIKWLFKTYSKREIIDVFIRVPYRNYPKENFYFIKNFILGLKNYNLNEEAYVTSIHGPIKPRAAGNF